MYPRLGYIGLTQEDQYHGEGAEGSPENMPLPVETNTATVTTAGGQVAVSAPVFDPRDWAIRFASNMAGVGPQIAALDSGQVDQVHSAFLNYMVGENHNDLTVMENAWNQFVLGIAPPPAAAPPTCGPGEVWDPARQMCIAMPTPDGPGSAPAAPPLPWSAPSPASSGGSGGNTGLPPAAPDGGITTETNDVPGAADILPDGTPVAAAGVSGPLAIALALGLGLALVRGRGR